MPNPISPLERRHDARRRDGVLYLLAGFFFCPGILVLDLYFDRSDYLALYIFLWIAAMVPLTWGFFLFGKEIIYYAWLCIRPITSRRRTVFFLLATATLTAAAHTSLVFWFRYPYDSKDFSMYMAADFYFISAPGLSLPPGFDLDAFAPRPSDHWYWNNANFYYRVQGNEHLAASGIPLQHQRELAQRLSALLERLKVDRRVTLEELLANLKAHIPWLTLDEVSAPTSPAIVHGTFFQRAKYFRFKRDTGQTAFAIPYSPGPYFAAVATGNTFAFLSYNYYIDGRGQKQEHNGTLTYIDTATQTIIYYQPPEPRHDPTFHPFHSLWLCLLALTAASALLLAPFFFLHTIPFPDAPQP